MRHFLKIADCDVLPILRAVVADPEMSKLSPLWRGIPQTRGIIFDIMRRVEGVELITAEILMLPAGSDGESINNDDPAELYFVFLQNLPGASINLDDEMVTPRSGECWMANDGANFVNNSADDLVVLQLKIRSA